MRGRVRLHGGGISPGEVRLRARGASERRTAPGKDIRDIGPEEPRKCRSCGDRAYAPMKECGPCVADLKIIREVSALLRKHGQPPLSHDTGPGLGYRKPRARGRQAEARITKRRRQNGMPPARPGGRAAAAPAPRPARRPSRGAKTCPQCFTQKAKSGACLCS